MVDFPTRNTNILDLILTNIPNKLHHIQGFEDILRTDHQLISFDVDLKIPKKPDVKRTVYNFKKANWEGLKDLYTNKKTLGYMLCPE